MISLQQREYANGYLDVLTSNEMLDRGDELFRKRRIEVAAVEHNRRAVKNFDRAASDAESQAADRRAGMVRRMAAAEARRVEAEIAIEVFILEAAEAIKAKRAVSQI